MLGLLARNPLEFIISAALLVMAIAVHEFSHALAADRLGDPSPRLAGRLTLNPMAHLDPVGTLLLLFVGFGWGKPVGFDPFNLKNVKRDAAIISFAGPLSNLIMAALAASFLQILSRGMLSISTSLLPDILYQFMYVNVLLAVFNMIPVHPLDGFKVIAGLLPTKYYYDWLSLERYGMIFLIFLIVPFFGNAPINVILSPAVQFIISLLLPTRVGGII